jgi:2-polyprenyl-6-methoxyphenol hydroxylase-like FAD-dependent oxidoreductase
VKAQGLKQAGLGFRVFERDSSASFRAQGYRIRISVDAGRALRRLLPDRLWHVFEATAAEIRDDGQQFDALSGKAVRWATGPPKQAQGDAEAYNVDRAVLRNLLLRGIEKHVHFGKRFLAYEDGPQDNLNLRFSDGTVERSTLIIGADGVRSAVRHRRIPELGLLE